MSIEFTVRTFTIPSGFSSEAYLGASFNVIKGTGIYKIRFRFSKAVSGYICERTWHASQQVRKKKDGSCTLMLTLNSLDEIEHWILGWGEAVKVMSPLVLKRRVAERLRMASKQYAVKKQKST